jgi:hypothetical protein
MHRGTIGVLHMAAASLEHTTLSLVHAKLADTPSGGLSEVRARAM